MLERLARLFALGCLLLLALHELLPRAGGRFACVGSMHERAELCREPLACDGFGEERRPLVRPGLSRDKAPAGDLRLIVKEPAELACQQVGILRRVVVVLGGETPREQFLAVDADGLPFPHGHMPGAVIREQA